nr:DEAD-like helicase [Mimivirus sp.]URM62532.1 DEAD helicase [Mimivirus sp.]
MDTDGCLYDHDRIIIQIDSFLRITKDYNDDPIIFKHYDLVIIDEIEGNLNHYNSPFLKNQDCPVRKKFKIMTECIDSARKLLVLDADLSMRTKLFIDHFSSISDSQNKYLFINNTFKPIKKSFIITNDRCSFEKIFLMILIMVIICV